MSLRMVLSAREGCMCKPMPVCDSAGDRPWTSLLLFLSVKVCHHQLKHQTALDYQGFIRGTRLAWSEGELRIIIRVKESVLRRTFSAISDGLSPLRFVQVYSHLWPLTGALEFPWGGAGKYRGAFDLTTIRSEKFTRCLCFPSASAVFICLGCFSISQPQEGGSCSVM